jgi:hypothetical protein
MLTLQFTPGTLAAGDNFRLFYATNYSGAFTNLAPASPGPGLAWDTGLLLSNGTLRVVSAAAPSFNQLLLSGSSLVLGGTGGTPGNTYYVLSATNVAAPIGSWIPVGTGNFNGSGGFSFTNAIDVNTSHRFYLLQVP